MDLYGHIYDMMEKTCMMKICENQSIEDILPKKWDIDHTDHLSDCYAHI